MKIFVGISLLWDVASSRSHTVFMGGLVRLPHILSLVSGWGVFRDREEDFQV